jgi:hypothetical protein
VLQPSLGVSSLDLGRPSGRPLFVCVVGRHRISPEFVEEVAEWLSGADITFFFAGSTYAVVRTSVVENWPRVTSKRLSADLLKVAQGAFDCSTLEPLLAVSGQDVGGGRGEGVAGYEAGTAMMHHTVRRTVGRSPSVLYERRGRGQARTSDAFRTAQAARSCDPHLGAGRRNTDEARFCSKGRFDI